MELSRHADGSAVRPNMIVLHDSMTSNKNLIELHYRITYFYVTVVLPFSSRVSASYRRRLSARLVLVWLLHAAAAVLFAAAHDGFANADLPTLQATAPPHPPPVAALA